MLLIIMVLKMIFLAENLVAVITIEMILTLMASCKFCTNEELQVSYEYSKRDENNEELTISHNRQ